MQRNVQASNEQWRFLAETLLRSLGPASLYFIPWIHFWALEQEDGSSSTRSLDDFQFDTQPGANGDTLDAAKQALEIEKAVLQQRLAKAEGDLAALLLWKAEVRV